MLGDDPSDVGVGMLVGWTLGRMGADLDALLHEVEPVLAELDALTPCPSDPPRAPLP